MASAGKKLYRVSVRELVEFALRSGDLGGERDFVKPGRALAGIRGHQKLQRSRPAEYQKEVPVSIELEQERFTLRLQGRIDGVQRDPTTALIEEIKTVMPGWSQSADPLHWAQLKIYAWMFGRESGLATLLLRLTYVNLETGETTEFPQSFALEELQRFFDETIRIYLEWLGDWHHWTEIRNESIRSLQFPFSRYRPGQRQLAVAAYRTIAAGKRLFAEAPTGIGKTVSVLFPALKALGEGRVERVFYLTARTTARGVAEKCFVDLAASGLQARTLTLTAKDKICPRQGQPCDPAACPLAVGYYDRVRPAMRAALQHRTLSRAVIEAASAAHQVCPFELSLDLSMWVDAVICDYNYAFDPKVYLKRHFDNDSTDYAFLVDEAHNLVDRSRDMFSASLDLSEMREAAKAIKVAVPRCARALNKVCKAMRELTRAESGEDQEPSGAHTEPELFDRAAAREVPSADHQSSGSARQFLDGTIVETVAPAALMEAVEAAMQEAEAWLGRNEPATFREQLLQAYFQMFSFRRTAELYDERYVTVIRVEGAVGVKLFCVDPSLLLRKALERGKAAVFFSATLTPVDYYRNLLGGAENTETLCLASPFPSGNLSVLLERRIRTTFKTRGRSMRDVAEAIAALTAERVGNYLIYFPSYAYLGAVQELFTSLAPQVRVLTQRPGMTDREREQFLAEFVSAGEQTLAGFAVMGGVFGEGIDLVGERLIGTVVVGVGLPQVCAEREIIRSHFASRGGPGFEYAYLFPGLNRVLQASGRVIRSETDRGAVLLIDARFDERRYRDLLPPWWNIRRVRSAGEIREAAAQFWGGEALASNVVVAAHA